MSHRSNRHRSSLRLRHRYATWLKWKNPYRPENGTLFVAGSSRPLKFTAKIGIVGINPCVNVPEEISRVLGKKGNIPVRGAVNGFPFRSTLVPVKEGPYRLYLNMGMRKGAGAEAGDTVEILLEPDPDPRPEPVPGPLMDALGLDPGAAAAWDALAPSRRREILRYLNSLKSRDALARNVEKVIRILKGR